MKAVSVLPPFLLVALAEVAAEASELQAPVRGGMGPTGPGAPPSEPPDSPSPADCMGAAGCTPFFPPAPKERMVSTSRLLPALGLTALEVFSVSSPPEFLAYIQVPHGRVTPSCTLLGEGTGAEGRGSERAERKGPFQPPAGGSPALKHLSQGWLLPPCLSSEGCGEKPGDLWGLSI